MFRYFNILIFYRMLIFRYFNILIFYRVLIFRYFNILLFYRVLVVGDSAGGNLTASLTLKTIQVTSLIFYPQVKVFRYFTLIFHNQDHPIVKLPPCSWTRECSSWNFWNSLNSWNFGTFCTDHKCSWSFPKYLFSLELIREFW